MGSWFFHILRMRTAIARHDGVLSTVRAHSGDVLTFCGPDNGYLIFLRALYGANVWGTPMPRVFTLWFGLRPAWSPPSARNSVGASVVLEKFVKLFALYLLASFGWTIVRFPHGGRPLPADTNTLLLMYAHCSGVFLAAQFASLLGLLSLLFLPVVFPSHRFELRGDLESSAARMLWVFLPYAFIVLLSLSLLLMPSTGRLAQRH